MLLVVRISDCVEEVVVSPGAADILRRATSGCGDQARIGHAWDGISDALDADRMLPAVAEVVEVFERSGADVFQRVDEAGLAGIERSVAEVRIGPAPAYITCMDLVEMAVRPAHGCLQHKVQAIQADCER